jgi:hypothetical protein
LAARSCSFFEEEKLAYEEIVGVSFKENLIAKIKLNRISQSLVSTIREPPGRRWLDKGLLRELLAMTDFEHKKVRDLNLYIRPLEAETMEVAFRSRVGHAICAR